jgi:predicted Zn-dependent protease
MHFPSFTTLRRSFKRRTLAAFLLIAAPVGLLAQGSQQPAQQPPQLSDRVSEELGKLKPHLDAEAWDQALAIINGASTGTPSGSYDEAILAQMKAQILLQKGDYKGSIAPLERTVQLGREKGFFDQRALLEYTYYLAQLYYQEGSTTKDAAAQRTFLDKAISNIEQYLERAPSPTADARLFAASVMFAKAQLDPNNVDMALVQKAYEESQRGLRMSVKPNDRFYVLSLASLQLMNRMADSAELLEILVTKEPNNATYWQQLAATYLNLAGDQNIDETRAYEYQVRAILTIRRAQEQGVMNSQRDNFSLVGIYFNIQQFDRAIELLEKGLRSGGIENTQRNWELLASSYQQLKREFKAIEALKEGMTHFPNAGGLELQVANIYYSIDNLQEALNHTLAALRKGNLDSPAQAQSFGAYIAFELKQFDLALELAQEAAKDPNSRDAGRLLEHIKTTIQERDEALKSAK